MNFRPIFFFTVLDVGSLKYSWQNTIFMPQFMTIPTLKSYDCINCIKVSLQNKIIMKVEW